MNPTADPVSLLKQELERRMLRNPAYSQRAFARDVGLGAGAISEMFAGRRPLSIKVGRRVAERLGLTPEESEQFLIAVARALQPVSQGQKPTPPQTSALELDSDRFRFLSDWPCLAILSLSELPGFSADSKWIARKLGINKTLAASSLKRLANLGILTGRGKNWKINAERLVVPGGVPSAAIKEYHRQILGKALDALEFQRPDERTFQSIGLALDPAHFKRVEKEVSDFLDRITLRYGTESKKRRPEDVYQLEVGFFRLSAARTLKKGSPSK